MVETDSTNELMAAMAQVMGVALNGKDDLRMLRGAVIIGFAGVALLFIVPRTSPKKWLKIGQSYVKVS